MNNLTQEKLKELLNYDPNTGIFTWKVSRGGRKKGSIAGSHTSDGYIRLKINKKEHKAHRLAFLYMLGSFPIDKVDHKNRIRDDNRWDNIIESTSLENNRNKNISKNNTSGIKGVYRYNNKWRARIMVNGINIQLGNFDDLEDAHIARIEAEMKYGFD